jgi:hypothetical protein
MNQLRLEYKGRKALLITFQKVSRPSKLEWRLHRVTGGDLRQWHLPVGERGVFPCQLALP